VGAYLRPSRLNEALAALARPHLVLAGGTDIYPGWVGRPIDGDVLDIGAIVGLGGIDRVAGGWRIGAAVTWSQLLAAVLPAGFDALKQAAREVGGRQIQNAATLVGNVCNASPAADSLPCLLTLDAEIELSDRAGTRRLPVAEFVRGNRRTALQPGELATALLVPDAAAQSRSRFLKLGARRYLVISIASVAVALDVVEGRVAAARVAVGACSEVPCRLPALEAALRGAPADARLVERASAAHLAALRPIDDVRASGDYRRDAALTLVKRALAEVAA